MKIVKIIGGLGNQMFQYALYLSLKEKFPEEEVLVDTSYFATYHVHTGLELERVFGIDLHQASFGQLLKVTIPVKNYKLSRIIRKCLPKRSTECREATDYTFNQSVFEAGNKYYDGYWQNYLYFKEVVNEVRDVFQFRLPLSNQNKLLVEKINADAAAVSIHIRRGDYLKVKNYAGLCNLDYYKAAVAHIKNNVSEPHFFLFSDDVEWCKENIVNLLGPNVTIVDWNKGKDSPIDMLLMSRCKHNIIANSSFSWWAAFLNSNEGKIVCAPQKWTNTKVNCRFQLPDWILF